MERPDISGAEDSLESEDSEQFERTSSSALINVNNSNKQTTTNQRKRKMNKIETHLSSSSFSSPHMNFHIHNISKKPNEIRLPRIPKEDIRKQYPTMFLNIMNSMDFDLIASFYEECCSDNIQFRREVVSSVDHSRVIQSCVVRGVEEIVLLLRVVNLIYPDRIFRAIEAPRIITKSDTFRTEIIIDYSLTGHLIFNTDVIQAMNFILVFQEQYLKRQRLNPTVSFCPMNSEGYLKEFETSFFQRFSLLPSPEVSELQGQFFIMINNVYESEEIDEITMRSYGY